MPKPKTLTEALAAFDAQSTTLSTALADLAAAEALTQEAGQAQTTAETALATSKVAETEAKEKLTAETLRAEGLKAECNTLKAEAKTAESRAAEICAAAGVDPVKTTPGSESSDGTLFEQYSEIKDPMDKAAFLEQNKDALFKESSRK